MRKEKRIVSAMATRILLIVLTLALTAGAAEAMVVWTDHATVKIRPKSPAKPDQTSAILKAAKNEFESFQLIVTASAAPLSGVDVAVSDLTDPHGNVIPAGSIMIYKEVFINVGKPSTIQGGTGEWPDALIPKKDEYAGETRNAFPFSVGAGRNQPVWIEIYIPPTAASGKYVGAATVTATGQSPVAVPISLTVWNFQLPSTSTLKSAYAIDYHLLPKAHFGALFSSANSSHMALTQLYAKANLLHRITDSFLPGPQAMGGMANGGPNWGPFDATFGPFLDGTVILPGGKLPGSKMTAYQMSFAGHETDTTFLRNVADHFKAKGWFDRLFQYTCDEPRPEPTNACSFNDIKVRANALHQADPALRSLVTTSVQKAEKYGVAGYIDLLTPTIRFMDDKWIKSRSSEVPENEWMVGNQRSKYGAEVWWYQACGSHGCGIIGGGSNDPNGYHTDWPTYMIDLPAMFNRVMEWHTYKYNVQGLLYFDMVYAFGQKDPWATQYYFGGNGDGTLYYPGRPNKIGGTKHIPIESIRLKLIREGQEDYEYMHLLKTLGEGAYADEQVGRVITNTYTWNREALTLYNAREKMAIRILSLTDSLPPSPPLPPSLPPSLCPSEVSCPSEPVPAPPSSCLSLGSCSSDPEQPGNTRPVAVFKADLSDTNPLSLNFSGAESHDAEGAITSYLWDFGDGERGSGAEVSHPYLLAGTYKVSLTVSDTAGDSETLSAVVSATHVAGAPVAQWFSKPTANDATPSLAYTFDGSRSSGGGGSVTGYQWDLGDGTVKTDKIVQHEYSRPGAYEVKLTVTNDKSKSATAVYTLQLGEEVPSPGGGGGGGCAFIQKQGPTDWREAIPYLLVFFSPFFGLFWKKSRRRVDSIYDDTAGSGGASS